MLARVASYYIPDAVGADPVLTPGAVDISEPEIETDGSTGVTVMRWAQPASGEFFGDETVTRLIWALSADGGSTSLAYHGPTNRGRAAAAAGAAGPAP